MYLGLPRLEREERVCEVEDEVDDAQTLEGRELIYSAYHIVRITEHARFFEHLLPKWYSIR